MLSKRQQHILRFIHQHTLEHGFAPSIREISLATGITSTSVVTYNLERLIAWGYLVKSRGKSRALGLTERGSALFEPNQPVKIKRVGETFPVDELLDANLPNRDVSQLHQENLLLKAENERLRRESKNPRHCTSARDTVFVAGTTAGSTKFRTLSSLSKLNEIKDKAAPFEYLDDAGTECVQ